MNTSEQLKYIAFGKVKAGVTDVIRLLKSYEAIKLLEEVERVADLRINVIR